MRSVVIATLWDRIDVRGGVDPASPPTQAQLDAIADSLVACNCGVRPVVRVVEEFALPRFCVEDEGPACEDIDRGWQRGRA